MNEIKHLTLILSSMLALLGCDVEDLVDDEAPMETRVEQALTRPTGFTPPSTTTRPSLAEPSNCSNLRWVGVQSYAKERGCPPSVVVRGSSSMTGDINNINPAGKWEMSYVSGAAMPIQPGLKGLCAYTWVPGQATDPTLYLSYLPKHGHSSYADWLTRDCQVMTTFGAEQFPGAYTPWDLGRGYNAQILKQVGAMSSYPTRQTADRAWVQVSVIDNDPTSNSYVRPDSSDYNQTDPAAPRNMNWVLGPGVSGHGYGLSRLIENVVNPLGQTYKTQIEMEQGLLYSGPDTVDTENGGHTGTPWQLAQAIHRVVSRYILRVMTWTPSPTVPTPPRLVINLSVGWDPRWGGEITQYSSELSTSHPEMKAVYDELYHARCWGALIFAAAGNAINANETGAVFPAAWERLPAPSWNACVEFEGAFYSNEVPSPGLFSSEYKTRFSSIPIFRNDDPDYGPLLYAVSGVEGNDLSLSNARPDSSTRFVAPGALGVGVIYANQVEKFPGSGGLSSTTAPRATKIMTGSSVSTALASATAAVLWSYRPEMTPAQIADAMFQGGVALSGPVKVCQLGKNCAAPRRLSVCNALKKMCQQNYSGQVNACPTTSAAFDNCVTQAGQVSQIDPPGFAPATMLTALQNLNKNCQSQPQATTSCQPTNAENFYDIAAPLPSAMSPYSMPRIGPQPIDGWCPGCYFKTDLTSDVLDLNYQVVESFAYTVKNPRMTLYYKDGSQENLALPISNVVNGKSYWITNLAHDGKLSDLKSASLAGTAAVGGAFFAPTFFMAQQIQPAFRTLGVATPIN